MLAAGGPAMRMLVVANLVLWLAVQCQAGPWPRAEGETFLSVSLEAPLVQGDGLFTLYGEHGLNDRLTLGLDMGATRQKMQKTVVFARLPFGQAPGGMRLAFELGVGILRDQPVIRPGLSFGRGFSLSGRPGWITLDTRAVIFQDVLHGDYDADFETDVTLGIETWRKTRAIVQLRAGVPAYGDEYLKIAPSWVIPAAPGRHLEIGVTAGLVGSSAIAAKIALWHSF
ncbi:hypothetical protein [Roseovarius litoreus]|nr:hypothetical protein [Roseovarius litoreus]